MKIKFSKKDSNEEMLRRIRKIIDDHESELGDMYMVFINKVDEFEEKYECPINFEIMDHPVLVISSTSGLNKYVSHKTMKDHFRKQQERKIPYTNPLNNMLWLGSASNKNGAPPPLVVDRNMEHNLKSATLSFVNEVLRLLLTKVGRLYPKCDIGEVDETSTGNRCCCIS